MECQWTGHDPKRGIVDETCDSPPTGDDGLCDDHRASRKVNQNKRRAKKDRCSE